MTNDNELLKVKEEINKLKESIKNTHLNNIKNFHIRNLKICGNIITALMPYMLVITGINYMAEKINLTPITIDNVKHYEHSMNYFNSNGDEVETITYGTYDDQKSELYFTSTWEQNEDGEFVQKREKYKIGNDINQDIVYEIVTSKNEFLLKPVLGNPVETELAVRKELTDEEKEEKTSFEATINRENKENFVLRPETEIRNTLSTLVDISLTLSISILYGNSKYMNTRFSNIEKANNDYKIVNTKELEKKLKEQKQKYKTLSKKI